MFIAGCTFSIKFLFFLFLEFSLAPCCVYLGLFAIHELKNDANLSLVVPEYRIFSCEQD